MSSYTKDSFRIMLKSRCSEYMEREGYSTVCTLDISYQLSFIFNFFSRIKGKHQKPMRERARGLERDYFARYRKKARGPRETFVDLNHITLKYNTMKKAVVASMLAGSLLFSSCLGSFSAFNNLKDWNQGVTDSKFLDNLIFWGLTIVPVYPLFFLGDTLIFNVIEFWSG